MSHAERTEWKRAGHGRRMDDSTWPEAHEA